MNSEQQDQKPEKKGFFTKFSGQFWLVVMFEFFERGAYYGMMSFISQYFVDTLGFSAEAVGDIKGVIQPLLYFLPILAGAIADRFGYRKMLMVAFTLLGGGYFLTSQMTSYSGVFMALVIMGVGAGAFKPMISGTIARITDESNSTQAFGIYYWSINMGAFLFPLFLVPILKRMNPAYVIIASAICTAAMIIPTAFFFKEPVKQKEAEDKAAKREQATMLQTMANAFEIIYSPLVLLYNMMKKSAAWKFIVVIILVAGLAFSVMGYFEKDPAVSGFPTIGIQKGDTTLVFKVHRDMLKKDPYKLEEKNVQEHKAVALTIYKPNSFDSYSEKLVAELNAMPPLQGITAQNIKDYSEWSENKLRLEFVLNPELPEDFKVEKNGERQFTVHFKNLDVYPDNKEGVLKSMQDQFPQLRGIALKNCRKVYDILKGRSFFWFFVISVVMIALVIVAVTIKKSGAAAQKLDTASNGGFHPTMLLVFAVIALIFLIPGLGMLSRIVGAVIYLSIMSLFLIDKSDTKKFVDHGKFLLMIILYSGFWVLYFQMFDSVLWYVQAYVDATSLNEVIGSIIGNKDWFFDVEHVTVINAGTIILLQLVVSAIVKKKKALPTMITGIVIATCGMAMLAISTSIWVFMAGIVIFSIGEMTAHPKFISYVGLTAPSDKKAMYMGYIFLYGVFGSSVGAIVGSRLYAHFVIGLNQPRTLWLIFTGIGVFTIVCLLLYNKFLAPKKETSA